MDSPLRGLINHGPLFSSFSVYHPSARRAPQPHRELLSEHCLSAWRALARSRELRPLSRIPALRGIRTSCTAQRPVGRGTQGTGPILAGERSGRAFFGYFDPRHPWRGPCGRAARVQFCSWQNCLCRSKDKFDGIEFGQAKPARSAKARDGFRQSNTAAGRDPFSNEVEPRGARQTNRTNPYPTLCPRSPSNPPSICNSVSSL